MTARNDTWEWDSDGGRETVASWEWDSDGGRDVLPQRLYANPRMSYAHARTLRKDLKRAELPVENREIRKLLVDSIIASRA